MLFLQERESAVMNNLNYSINICTVYFKKENYMIDPFSATRRYTRHQNKVKVKGLGRKSSYLDGFTNFLWFYEKVQSVG